MKRTIIYIDGFNLYYRLKGTPYKWLNLQKLIQFYLKPKTHEIKKIKYFTARVKRKPNDASNIIRQNMYLRAVRTVPNLEIIFGKFKKRQLKGPRLHYENGQYREGKESVAISKWEEKQSDVHIATHVVSDSYQNRLDCAVLISNDTDLTPPLLHIKHDLKKLVIVISPYQNIHADLKKSSHFYKTISLEALERCQFLEKMKDAKGFFFCPPKWKRQEG